jgi:copper chaperone CopZ
MKTIVFSLSLFLGFFLFNPLQMNAQCEKESKDKSVKVAEAKDCDLENKSFAVQGNCGMCETRIEKAAKSVDGVKKAKWDKSSDKLTVYFPKGKVNMMDVHKAIANAGHDTSEKKASDDTYASLPGCCKYR